MFKAYKYRLYPTKEQAVLIDKHIGCCRFIYNLALETKRMAYDGNKVMLSAYDLHKQLTSLKEEHTWLNEVDSQALQQSINDLNKAYSNFFIGKSKFPNFKKNKGVQCFRNSHGVYVKIKNNKLYQVKFRDGIRINVDRVHIGKIKSTTISRTVTGKYFVSILCDTEKELPTKKSIKEKTTIGIDLGIKTFAVLSNGQEIANPKFLKQSIGRLKVLQRRLRNKKKGSNNKKKANLKIALLHERIANQRKDFLHKTSSKIISENQTICIEDLNIMGMVKNHSLSQSISDASWSEFVRQLKYKAEWYGKNVLQVPTYKPSTKICNECDTINTTITLAHREWICLGCGALHDRDKNAALSIKKYCLKNKSSLGKRVVPVELRTIVRTKKQEKSTIGKKIEV